MSKKPRFMQVPRTLGDVFAVEYVPHLWGYCRFIRGTAIEIPAVFTRTVGMPDIDWSSTDIERWRVLFLAIGTDPGPSIVHVGNAPFAHDAEADMPPTYRDPDAVEPRYTIEERGMYRYTSDPADLAGIAKRVALLPPTLGSFLSEKHANGTLREVGIRKKEQAGVSKQVEVGLLKCPVDLAAEQVDSETPTIVFAKIVEPIGPAEREQVYEERLAEFLSEHDLGEITGGGTMQDKDGSVLFTGIDIEVRDVKRAVPRIAQKLGELGAPQGPVLEYEGDDCPVTYPIPRPRAAGK